MSSFARQFRPWIARNKDRWLLKLIVNKLKWIDYFKNYIPTVLCLIILNEVKNDLKFLLISMRHGSENTSFFDLRVKNAHFATIQTQIGQ